MLEQHELGKIEFAAELDGFHDAGILVEKGLAEDHVALGLKAIDAANSSLWPVTVWHEVQAAAQDVGQSSERLNELILKYQRPLRIYLLQRFKAFPQIMENADDLLQEFAAQKILAKQWLGKASPERGKFRNFLKTSLKNYVIAWGRRVRLPSISLNDLEEAGKELPATEAADQSFELPFAQAVLAETLERLEQDCRHTKRQQPRSTHIWELFRLRMLDPIFKGTKPVSYEELAKVFSLRSPTEGTNMLLSAKRMFKRHLEEVIAEYEGTGAAKSELAALSQFVSSLAERK